jgi:hypothetical protein
LATQIGTVTIIGPSYGSGGHASASDSLATVAGVDELNHPLAAVLTAAVEGRFPSADGGFDVLPSDRDGTLAVVAFTGHAYVLADVASEALTAAGGDGLGGVLAPAVLSMLAGDRQHVGSTDVVLVRPGQPAVAGASDGLVELDVVRASRERPRVRRAVAHRREVCAFADDHGVVILGRGLVGRTELSVELNGPSAPAGAGRTLIAAGLAKVPSGEPCWAQVAAGNARSLRAFLASGFVPLCAEVLITPRASR